MTIKTRKRILQFSPVYQLFRWTKKVRFKKYGNVSLYRILRIFFRNLDKHEIMDRSNGVAFNFILAIFPAIIFLFTLIPYFTVYFPEINRDNILVFLKDFFPPNMYDVASTTILDIVSNQRGGLLTFGFFLAVFLSTNGMLSLMRAFNSCYRTIENRSAFRMRLTATALTLTTAVVVLMATALLVIGQLVLDYFLSHLNEFQYINLDDFTVFLIFLTRFVVIFIVFFLAISCIYYFGPAIHYNWRFFSFGSLMATVLSLAVSYGFSYYVTNFGTYNKVYGSIGVMIALMVYVQLITLVLLIGYEINASIHQAVRDEALWRSRQVRKS